MNKTKIEWVKNPDGSQGYSWNPIKGICPVGCWYCYARKIYQRFNMNERLYWGHEKPIFLLRDIFPVERRKKRSGIFVCSTFEIFHKSVPFTWRDEIFKTVENCPQHRFYILTKFPQNIDRPMPENVWLGVTITGHKDIWRLKDLLKISAKIRFVSIEPFLENIYVSASELFTQMDWIIIGRLTGYGKRRDPLLWPIQGIVTLAKHNNIPIFLKDNLKDIWGEDLIQEFPKC